MVDFFVSALYACVGALVTNINRDEEDKVRRFIWDVYAALCYMAAGIFVSCEVTI